MKKRILHLLVLITLVCLNIVAVQAQNGSIAWATENVAADANYISELESAGYTVDAVENKWVNLTSANATLLNEYDLVIISKRTNSGQYGDGGVVTANWQSVTSPVINLNNYVNRSSRLQFFNTTVNNEAVGKYMAIKQANHPIFTNAVLEIDGVAQELTTEAFQGNDNTTAGNGTVLASNLDSDIVTIAIWDAGVACYTGAGVQAGKRMWYACSYSYNFTSVGLTLFLDAVEYMITGSVTENTPTGIDNSLESKEMLLSPNPGTDFLMVKNMQVSSGSIFSVTGMKIKDIQPNTQRIDISDLGTGVYLISIISEGKQYKSKFIKQ